jgi:hypothetical protein
VKYKGHDRKGHGSGGGFVEKKGENCMRSENQMKGREGKRVGTGI